ncbi:anthranilate synthase component 1 [Actinomyces vulturis]|uniref:anthranilate synthase component 1 n=1 Tax=Actinomyces vulturis TaxID=1857645 RepID=UPI00082BBC4D|nr:anthranilate synthase component 1 [Actinomyces vulturis]
MRSCDAITPPVVATRQVSYHPDSTAIVRHLVNQELIASHDGRPTDCVVLDSADIASKQSLTSIAVLDSTVRLTCRGPKVIVDAVGSSDDSSSSIHRLANELAEHVVEQSDTRLILHIDSVKESEMDERSRLKSLSTLAPLRLLAHAEVDHPHLPLIAGSFAFDYLDSIEDLPPVDDGANTWPDYLFYDAAIIMVTDHTSATISLVGASYDGDYINRRLDELAASISSFATASGEQVSETVAAASAEENGEETGSQDIIHACPTVSNTDFEHMVTQMQAHIADGDIYQVVPSRGFVMNCPNPMEAYAHLRATNPSPYMFYLSTPEGELFGASPESSLLYHVPTNEVSIRPIAGTRPRGLNPDGTIDHERDTRLELELRTDNKELAEHLMLVDLARNDVARVSTPGTRQVTTLLRVDRYSRVMHLVSEVTGQLAEDLDSLDALRASMTMGTLTGAPKISAASLIRRYEGQRRGSYGGAVGYLRGDGELDTCIVIRSAFVRDGKALVQAGAGVVGSSQPHAEAMETVHKARAVLEAIAAAQGVDLVIDKEARPCV